MDDLLKIKLLSEGNGTSGGVMTLAAVAIVAVVILLIAFGGSGFGGGDNSFVSGADSQKLADIHAGVKEIAAGIVLTNNNIANVNQNVISQSTAIQTQAIENYNSLLAKIVAIPTT